VRVVVHGVDAPLVACAVVLCMADAVQRGVAHDHIGRGHVDLGAQYLLTIGKFARAHAPEQVEVFLHATVATGALAAGLGQRASVLAYLFGREVVHIGLAHADELLGVGIELFEVVGSVKFAVVPHPAEPMHVFADGIDVFRLFLGGVGIVKAQVALAAKFFGNAKVEADGFGMPQMQIPVWLRGKTRVHEAAKTARGVVFGNAGADKVETDFCCFASGFAFCCQRGGGHRIFFGGHNALQ